MEHTLFTGFTPQTFEFFMKIGFDNTPSRFESLRPEFTAYVMAPLKQLSLSLSPLLSKVDARLDLRPVMGGTISRIRRDTRFSKNKAPYRDRMWLKFTTKGKHARLAFYFDLAPGDCVFGLGITDGHPKDMQAKRQYLLSHPVQTQALVRTLYDQGYGLYGDCYKRPPLQSADPLLMGLLQRKWFAFEKPVDMKTVMSSQLIGQLREGYQQLTPFYQFFENQFEEDFICNH